MPSSSSTVQLPPPVTAEIARLLAKLRRRGEAKSDTLSIARKTLEIMRTLVATSNTKDVHALIQMIKHAGATMVAAQPHELVIGNMVRRVLATVREELASAELQKEAGELQKADGSGRGERTSAGGDAGPTAGPAAGPSLMKLLDAPDAPDYSRQPAKALKGPILEGINEVLEELSSVAAHIAEQAIEHIHSNEVILTHGRDPTDADRKRSAPQRELAKLKTDLDKYIGALDGTGGGGAGSAPDSDEDGIAAAKRAERGRVKAKMRRWDKDYEREHGRKPTEAARAASVEFSALRERLQELPRDDSPSGGGTSPTKEHGRHHRGSRSRKASTSSSSSSAAAVFGGGSAPPLAPLSSQGEQLRAQQYHELALQRVESQVVVDGFAGLTSAEVQAASAAFAMYDFDGDGVVNLDDFVFALTSIAQHAGRPALEPERAKRLFAAADLDGNGAIDFNEFLELQRRKRAIQTWTGGIAAEGG